MCSNLTSVTIESDAVVSATRKQTSSLNDIFGVQVKNYILGDEITSIGDYAFYNCSRLTSINIPKSLTKIGKYAFSGCSDLKKIIVTDIDAWCKIDFGEATSNPLYYAKRLYSDSDTEITEVVFPNGITAVGNYVFYNSTGLKSVTIPSSVTSIGDFAFYNCTSLSITLPDNIRSIGKKAFHEYARIRANNGTVTPLTLWNYGWTNGINDISTNYSFFAPALTATTTQTSINWTLSNYQAGYQYSIDDTALTGTTYSESVTGLCPEYGITHLLKVSLDDVSYSKYFTARTNDLNVSINSTNTTASSISLEGAYVAGDAEIESVALTLSGKTVNASSSLFTGLYPGSSYTAKYVVKVKYGDNQTRDYTATKTIKTAALTMTTAQPKVVSEGNAIIAADTNLDDAETNVGFEWRREDWSSTFASNTATAALYEGRMEGYIRNVNTNYLWKYRPYYLPDNSSLYIYGDWVGLDPTNTSYFEPTVHTYAKISIKGNTALVKGYALRGSDGVKVQGFKYWKRVAGVRSGVAAAAVPNNAMTVEAAGQVMTASLQNLEYLTDYCYVAFVTTTEGETFYGEQQTFTTGEDLTGIEPASSNTMTLDVVARYDMNGRRIASPQRGLNILRMNDGSIRKVIVK